MHLMLVGGYIDKLHHTCHMKNLILNFTLIFSCQICQLSDDRNEKSSPKAIMGIFIRSDLI